MAAQKTKRKRGQLTPEINPDTLLELAQKQIELDQTIEARDQAKQEQDRAEAALCSLRGWLTEINNLADNAIDMFLILDQPIDYQQVGRNFDKVAAAEAKRPEGTEDWDKFKPKLKQLADTCQQLRNEIEQGTIAICRSSWNRMQNADRKLKTTATADRAAQDRVDSARAEVRRILRRAWRSNLLADESTRAAVEQAVEEARLAAAEKAETHRALREANDLDQQTRKAFSQEEGAVRQQIRQAVAELVRQAEPVNA